MSDMYTKQQNLDISEKCVHETDISIHEQWDTSDMAHRAGGLSVEQSEKESTLQEISDIGQEAHTDHPMRHWDRTCPACVAEVKKEGDWVSLTDKEIKTIIDSGHGEFMVIKIAESKLRERNT